MFTTTNAVATTISWNSSMLNRSRAAYLFMLTPDGGVYEFQGKTIPGVCAVKADKYVKNGKWSGSDYEIVVAAGVLPVRFNRPFEGWGTTWKDHVDAVRLFWGEVGEDKEEIVARIMRVHHDPKVRELAAIADAEVVALAEIMAPAPVMGARWLLNAFSLGMLPGDCEVRVREISRPENLGDYLSGIGHPTTASILGVECNRETVSLERGETCLVAQYNGPRLPEGTTTLPEGASFRWLEVTVI